MFWARYFGGKMCVSGSDFTFTGNGTSPSLGVMNLARTISVFNVAKALLCGR